MKQLTLFALLSAPLMAQVKEEVKAPTPAVAAPENAPLTPAERNYVLNILAQSIDSLADSYISGVDLNGPNANLLAIEIELARNNVPLNELSEEQRNFLLQERKIQQNAAKNMKGKNEDMQREIFQTSQQMMEAHHKTASPHVKRLFGTGHLFDAVVIEAQFDNKLRAILSAVPAPTMQTPAQLDDTIKKLRTFAAEIREMRR